MTAEFYDELIMSSRFCEKLGRLFLLSGKLEYSLKSLIIDKNIKVSFPLEKATLGQLVRAYKNSGLLPEGIDELFDFILARRNFLTHNLYSIFNDDVVSPLIPNKDFNEDDANYSFPKKIDDLISYINSVLEILTSD